MERLVNYDSESLLISKPYHKSIGLPLLQHTWLFASILLIQFYIIHKLIPQLMLIRKAFDLRPYMLVLNGLHFGTYGVGIVVFSYSLNLRENVWKCGRELKGLQEAGLIYSGYLYLLLKLLENVTYMIMCLRKKSQNATAKASSNIYHTLLLFFILKYRPIYIFFMEPFMEVGKFFLRYSYYTLKSAKATDSFGWLKKLVIIFSMITNFFNFYHAYYLLSSGCNPFPALQLAILIGSAIELIYTAIINFTPQKGKIL